MDAFIGEVRAFPFQFVPAGWLECNGQKVPIQYQQALYSIIGWIYGGDQKTYFNVPKIQGYAVIGAGTSNTAPPTTYEPGKIVGTSAVTLSSAQMPKHTHTAQTQGTANRVTGPAPAGSNLVLSPSYTTGGKTYALPMYATNPDSNLLHSMQPQTLQPALGGPQGLTQPHNNVSPYVIFRYCICTNGTYPDLS